MRRRLPAAFLGAGLALLVVAGPTLACGGLIGPNGAVNLLRTTTLAAYHEGVEHYVTAFQFQGGGGAFGSITPLPGVPSKVEKGVAKLVFSRKLPRSGFLLAAPFRMRRLPTAPTTCWLTFAGAFMLAARLIS